MNNSRTHNFAITRELNIRVEETGVIFSKEIKAKSGDEYHQSMPLSFNDWFAFCNNIKYVVNWLDDGLKVINENPPNGKCPVENQHLILSSESAIFLHVNEGKGKWNGKIFLNISVHGWFESYRDNKIVPFL